MTFIPIDIIVRITINKGTIETRMSMKVNNKIYLIALKFKRKNKQIFSATVLHDQHTSELSISLSKFFVAKIVGLENSVATFQTRFKSWPIKLHRLLPRKTPSGLSIGIILKTKFSLKQHAIG